MCTWMWECVHVSAGVPRVSDPFELKLQVIVSCPAWMLDTELGFSVRAMHALHGWASSPALGCLLILVILKRWRSNSSLFTQEHWARSGVLFVSHSWGWVTAIFKYIHHLWNILSSAGQLHKTKESTPKLIMPGQKHRLGLCGKMKKSWLKKTPKTKTKNTK